MKRHAINIVLALLVCLQLSAQESEWKTKYDNHVRKVGVSGVGVETILDRWAQADSCDVDYLRARFAFWMDRSAYTEVVSDRKKNYLGMEPILALKDSVGTDVFYFQMQKYDPDVFARALRQVDKAIRLYPERLDLRTEKASALVAYDRESPDVALSFLLALADENARGHADWVFPGYEKVDNDFFCSVMQEYCVAFFTIGSTQSREAFRTLSSKMLSYNKNNVDFLGNLGSYYLVNKEFKTALRYYDKVLKIVPSHLNAIKNGVTASIQMKDVKLQKKYLSLMVRYGSDQDKTAAKARLDKISK